MKEITRQKLSHLYFDRLDATPQEISVETERRAEEKIRGVQLGIESAKGILLGEKVYVSNTSLIDAVDSKKIGLFICSDSNINRVIIKSENSRSNPFHMSDVREYKYAVKVTH